VTLSTAGPPVDAPDRAVSVVATTLTARSRSLRAAWGPAGAGVVCIAAGVLLAIGPPVDVGTVPATAAGASTAAPGDARRAAPVPSVNPPAAAGTVPVSLTLPARGITAPVVPVATGPDGALVVPDPPTTVGWWAPGALAGASTGTTVLVGHVDSAGAGLGTFAVLRDLAVGDRIVLRGADGGAPAYRVTARRRLGKAALPADLFAADGPPRLVLITCGGRFDRTTRHYTDNVIVYAEPE
jgi:hypothetical protein